MGPASKMFQKMSKKMNERFLCDHLELSLHSAPPSRYHEYLRMREGELLTPSYDRAALHFVFAMNLVAVGTELSI